MLSTCANSWERVRIQDKSNKIFSISSTINDSVKRKMFSQKPQIPSLEMSKLFLAPLLISAANFGLREIELSKATLHRLPDMVFHYFHIRLLHVDRKHQR